jgi:hypothetical protein
MRIRRIGPPIRRSRRSRNAIAQANLDSTAAEEQALQLKEAELKDQLRIEEAKLGNLQDEWPAWITYMKTQAGLQQPTGTASEFA